MKKIYFVHIFVLFFLILNIFNLKNITLIDWDEGVFALQGKWLASSGGDGKPFNFQTPPLFQLIIALIFKVFGYRDTILPIISIIFSVLTIYVLFLLGSELFSEGVGLFAVVLFISTEYFLFFSKSGLSDATFLFFFITALYFFFYGLKTNLTRHYILAGVFTLLACYTKYSGPILFPIILAIGTIYRKKINKYWFLFSVLFPLLLLLPYLFIFLKIIKVSGISQRFGNLLGINHLKFLFYIIRFAPLIFVTAILYRIKHKPDYLLLITASIFFLILGFYYHYFRLAYPVIPILALFSASFLYKFKKMRNYLLILIFIINILFSWDTITYHSYLPESIGIKTYSLCRDYDIRYSFIVAPPNITFYIKGDILLPEDYLGIDILKKIKFLKEREIIERENNLLKDQQSVLLIYSSIFEETIKELKLAEYERQLIDSFEFIDAPVYYKDLFNPLRNEKQVYKIYTINLKNTNPQLLEKLWELGFNPRVSFLKFKI